MSAEKKQKAHQELISAAKLNHDTVVANIAKYRSPVFVKDNKQMKLKNTAAEKDQYEYVPGSIVDQQMRDYEFIQAPLNEKTALDLWRTVWQDQTRLVCSVSQENLIGEEASSKCWPYWPRSEDKSISYDNGRFVVKCKKKGGDRKKGFTIYELTVVGPPDEDKKGGEEGGGDTEERPVTLLHFEKWAPEKWMDGENVFHLVMELHNRTQQICRKVTDGYFPPILLQGYEALGRTAIICLGMCLARDCETKTKYDPPTTMRSIAKMRPGAFSNRLHWTYGWALCYRIAYYTTWTNDWKNTAEEMRKGLDAAKLIPVEPRV
ncbi:unnamed protein product, partial [Mesorhabditis spiculigera]